MKPSGRPMADADLPDYGLLGLTFSPPVQYLPLQDVHKKKGASRQQRKKAAKKGIASAPDNTSAIHPFAPSAPNVDLSDYGLLGMTFSPPMPNVKISDVHNKKEAAPRHSRAAAIKGFASTLDVAKKFQQVMGQQEPVPFVCPPDMPQDLEQNFLAGLEEYGLYQRMQQMHSGLDALSEAASMQGMMPQPVTGMEKTKLPDILEEKESPTKTLADTEQEDDLRYAPHSWQSNPMSNPENLGPYAATPFGHSRRSADGHSASDTEVDDTLDTWRPRPADFFGSSSTIAGNMGSRPESSTNATGQTSASSLTVPPAVPLFPSTRVGVQSCEDDSNAPYRFASADHAAGRVSAAHVQSYVGPLSQPQNMKAPQIKVQVPSPKKMSSSKKRGPSFSGEKLFGRHLKGARVDDNSTGLPTLPTKAEELWEVDFPGNTGALLTILLTWSLKMQTFHKLLPNVKAFPYHNAFPFPVAPPVHNRVISAGFYDTSVQPHREVRFLGPGDAAEMAYGEVDTFRCEEDLQAFLEDSQKRKFGPFKQTPGLDRQKESRHTDMHHRAATGEGRWCYILIKGHQIPASETAPHIILAWHISAVTDSSTCLHTIMPDGVIPAQPARPPPNPPLKRYSSLKDLWVSSQNQKHVNRVLRAARSSGPLQIEAADIAPQKGSQTLERTVLKLAKAGSIPLIEGYRVDVMKFKAWMDAVGRGQGKVIFWRERE